MSFQQVIAVLLGTFAAISKCMPLEEANSLYKLLPIVSTVNHELPSAGRMIPVKVIHFRNIAIPPSSPSSGSSGPSSFMANYPMVPRGFKDDFDIKPFRRSQLEVKFEMHVPIIPQNTTSTDWVPGELIVTGITRRQVKMIDQSQFGPLRSVTFIPSVHSGIMVFEKRYNPEKLAIALKYLFGVESEPNGVITTTS